MYYMRGTDFDWYGDVDDMAKVLAYLQRRGLKTRLSKSRNTSIDKKTAYANVSYGLHPKDMPLSQLYTSGEFPPYQLFFDRDLLKSFLQEYEDDVNLYLRVRKIAMKEYIQSFEKM